MRPKKCLRPIRLWKGVFLDVGDDGRPGSVYAGRHPLPGIDKIRQSDQLIRTE